jgi:ABC-type branched-subunit amino acid transport system substrate-binding protein
LQARAGEAGMKELTFSQMEGFLSAKFLVEGLKRAGKNLNRDALVRALEDMKKHDLGGYLVELSATKHSSGKFVDLMILGVDGKFRR